MFHAVLGNAARNSFQAINGTTTPSLIFVNMPASMSIPFETIKLASKTLKLSCYVYLHRSHRYFHWKSFIRVGHGITRYINICVITTSLRSFASITTARVIGVL